MNHTEILSRYTANFVDELINSGIKEVVISPGSRSTPLAIPFLKHKGVREWVLVDERSAAFFALGMAKEMNHPVALLCTSGTAAANYYPAIIEAHYSQVPLIVLTADRPHELRDVGAPQAIEQHSMYGKYVKWFHDMALPEANEQMLAYVRAKASRAVEVAKAHNAGPVQLNFPFREPLIPDLSIEQVWGQPSTACFNVSFQGVNQLSDHQADLLLNQMKDMSKGLIVCGPQVDEALAEYIVSLASLLKIPVLADPLSQLRSGRHDKEVIIESYDALFRDQTIRQTLKPDYIIRFGAMPVSKMYLFYTQEHADILQYVVEPYEGFRDPTGNRTNFIYTDPLTLCKNLKNHAMHVKKDHMWLSKWQAMNHIAKRELLMDSNSEAILSEGNAILSALQWMPENSSLYIGNSMAVRDLDTFFMATDKNIKVLANRGANGIDGIVSSSLGSAAVANHPVTLIIGDLSFYHDLNGLLAAKKYNLHLTILLINNNGGGIFSFLPQAKDDSLFEPLFGTPLDLEFSHTVKMYGGKYTMATDQKTLTQALITSYQNKGLSVIEVRTNRTENANWHKEKWNRVIDELKIYER